MNAPLVLLAIALCLMGAFLLLKLHRNPRARLWRREPKRQYPADACREWNHRYVLHYYQLFILPDLAGESTAYTKARQNLGRGDWQEARALLEQALEQADVPPTQDLAMLTSALGVANVVGGCYREAQALLQRARDLLPDGEPNLHAVQIENNLGALLCARYECGQAQEYLSRSVEELGEQLGEQHPDAVAAYHNAYFNRFVYSTQEDLAVRLDIKDVARYYHSLCDSLGARHPATLPLRCFYSRFMEEDELEEFFGDFRARCGELLPPEHPWQALVELEHAIALWEEPARAVPYLETGLERCLFLCGEKHPFAAEFHALLADRLHCLESLEQAQEHYEQALDIYLSIWGYQNPRTASCLRGLAQMLAQGKECPEDAVEPYIMSLYLAQNYFPRGTDLKRLLGGIYRLYQKLKLGDEEGYPQWLEENLTRAQETVEQACPGADEVGTR